MAGKLALHRVVAKEGNNEWNHEHAVLEHTIPCPDPRDPRFPTGSQDVSIKETYTTQRTQVESRSYPASRVGVRD